MVLDFPGNTKAQRAWFRQLFEGANAEHELHFVDGRMPWADVNLMIEARTFLRAPSGQQMQSSKRSPSISSLPQRRKTSTSSITSTPNHTLVPPAKSLRALVSSRGSAAAQREGYRDERIGKEER